MADLFTAGNPPTQTAVPTLATSGTIATSNNGVVIPKQEVTTGGAVTGIILGAGIVDGQQCVVINQSANSITFAAVGTSNVADGVSAVIAATTRATFVWSAQAAKWYHGN